MRELGLLPAPSYIQGIDHTLLNYLDVQFRRLEESWRRLDSAAPSGAAIPAGNVIAGTFGSNVGNGNYVFPGNLAVTTTLTNNGNSISGSIGRNWFKDTERTSGAGLRVGAAWGKYGIYSEDGDVTIGAASNRISIQGDGLGWMDGNGWNTSRCYMGVSGGHGGAWAQFSHSSYWNSTLHYGMMHDGGSVLLSGNEVILRFQNDNRIVAAGGDVWLNRPLNMRGYQIWMKQYNDDTHRIDYDGGFDGFVFSTWGNMDFYMTGGYRVRFQSDGIVIGRYVGDQGGNWDRGPIRAEDNVGGSANVSHHCPGEVASVMELWRGDDSIHWRRSGGAWMWVHCDVDDLSMESIKKDIRNLESTRVKVRNIHPKKYKRKKPTDPGAPLIIARHAEERLQWEEQCREGRWSPESIAQDEAYWESEEVGFLSEEMAEVFPEVVTRDKEGNPLGIRYQKLTPILWQMNQEQDEEIEDLKRRIVILESKK